MIKKTDFRTDGAPSALGLYFRRRAAEGTVPARWADFSFVLRLHPETPTSLPRENVSGYADLMDGMKQPISDWQFMMSKEEMGVIRNGRNNG